MDIIGKWKVNKVLQMGDAGSEWRTRDEVKDVEPEDVDELFHGLRGWSRCLVIG